MEAAGLTGQESLPRRGNLKLPERHFGLVQAAEHPDLDRAIADYAVFLHENVDLAALKAAARGIALPPQGAMPKPPAQRIAMAQDAAFSFVYPHQVAGWRSARR